MRDLPHLATRLFDTPHLIRRGKLDTILSVVEPKLLENLPPRGRYMQASDVVSRRNAARFPRNGIVVIPIVGTLVRRGSWLAVSFGGRRRLLSAADIVPQHRPGLQPLRHSGQRVRLAVASCRIGGGAGRGGETCAPAPCRPIPSRRTMSRCRTRSWCMSRRALMHRSISDRWWSMAPEKHRRTSKRPYNVSLRDRRPISAETFCRALATRGRT